ncbi:immunity protein YezG family protein [Nocardia sp. NPDC050697]|uniref:immunity protein YezG family protein n=1 Tax=Nocardia sp. NPDC050697 TaxID=3155158 RepID=UPI0033D3B189
MELRTLLSPIEQHGLLSEIARLLLTVMPEDFRTAELDGYVLAGTSGYRLRVDAGDPEQMRRVTIPHGLDAAMRELRAGMYDPRRGSWYSLTLELSGTGKFSVAYNYDRRPSTSILDEEFSRDLSNFPRAEEFIPDWLRDVMSTAANTFGSILATPSLPDPHRIARAFRAAGWDVEPAADAEYTFTTGWARLTTMNGYPIVRFAGRTDLSRSAELEAVLATLEWHAEFETYDDRARLLDTIRVAPPKGNPHA